MLRNTPRNDALKSPCQRLFSRSTRTILPTTTIELQPKIVLGVPGELKNLRIRQGIYADRGAKPSDKLEVGDYVRMQTGHREWIGAKVVEETQYPRSVIVETNEGKRYRRNTHHLHTTNAKIQTPTVTWPEPESQPQSSITSLPVGHTEKSIQQNASEESTQSSSQQNVLDQPVMQPVTTRSGRIIKPVQRYGFQ